MRASSAVHLRPSVAVVECRTGVFGQIKGTSAGLLLYQQVPIRVYDRDVRMLRRTTLQRQTLPF